MSEIYIPHSPFDSFVVIQRAAADVVDETLVKTLRKSALVEVEGPRLVTEDPLTINAATGKHQAKEQPLECRLEPLGISMVRVATSLRMRRLEGRRPANLPQNVPILCLYEHIFDRYIDVPVLPELGFTIRHPQNLEIQNYI